MCETKMIMLLLTSTLLLANDDTNDTDNTDDVDDVNDANDVNDVDVNCQETRFEMIKFY
jgi:hypothetical protein